MPGPSDSNIRRSIGSAGIRPGAVRPSPAEIEAARRNPNLNLGRIVLLEELGRGGMGVVYRAWQDDLQRSVAVKVLAAQAPGNANERFLREARLASKLRHPNIVTVHEMGSHQGRPWFSMDLVEGSSLDPLVRGRKMPAKRLMEVMRDMARALDAAHEQGVVHRDIKPGNILVDPAGKPFLTDFGLAGDLDGGARLTMTGVVMGTPAYMSPEQARGSRGKPDHRTDIYSLGAVMYEGLTGRTVVPKDDIHVMVNAVVNGQPDAPRSLVPSVPQDAETICLKCLQKDPDRRYQSAGELADDIGRFLAGRPIQARASTLLEKASRSPWARPPVLAGMAAAALLLAAAVWAVGRSRSNDRELERRERAIAERESEIQRLQDALAKATDPEERRRLAEALAEKSGGSAPKPAADKPPVSGTTERPLDPVVPQPPTKDRIEELDRELAARLSRGEFTAARAFADALLPETTREREWRDSARARILDAARHAFDDIDARARALLADGKPAEAVALWETVAAIGIDDFARAAAARIEAARAPAAGNPREAALPRLGPLRDSVAALAAKRKYDDALKEIAALEKAEPSLAPDLATIRDAVEGARSLPGFAAKGAAALRGKEIATKAGPGVIGDAGEQSFQAKVGPATLTLAYADLAAGPLVQLAEAGSAPPESIGAFWLFEGRADLAAKAWAKSPGRQDLDALAESLKGASLEREARAALEELYKAAEKKDWKRCREVLAQRDRFSGTKAWGGVGERLDDIAFDAAERGGDELFVLAGRKTGAGQEWRYDFKDVAQLQDWGQTGGGFYSAGQLAGLGWEAGAVTLASCGMRFNAPLDGDLRISFDLTLTAFAREGCLEFIAGGYRMDIEEGGYANMHSPAGKKIAEADLTPFVVGKPVRVDLVLAGGRARGLVDGKEVLSAPMEQPVLPMQPRLELIKSAWTKVQRVTVSGRVAPGWAEIEKQRRAALARAARPSSLGRPVTLTDGKSLGLFSVREGGTWEVLDGALRGTSLSDAVHAELHFPEPRHRNVKLKFSYLAHSGRLFEVLMRSGDGRVAFLLPTDRPGKWREVEILLAEEAVRCTVDGEIPVLCYHPQVLVRQGGLRLMLQTASVSIRDVTIQEVKGLPAEPEWTILFNDAPVEELRATGMVFDKPSKRYQGTGSLEFDLKPGSWECVWRLEDCASRFVLELRGQKVAEFWCCYEGNLLLLEVKDDVANVFLNDVEIARGVRLPKGGGAVKLTASEGDAEIPAIYFRPLR